MKWSEITFDDPRLEAKTGLQIRGKYTFERWSPWGTRICRTEFYNDIVNEGLNHILNVQFYGATQITTWYLGLIGGSSVTIDEDDTSASHSGWTEDTNYSESTRQAWSPAESTGELSRNTSPVRYTMDAQTTIRGLFITSSSVAANDATGTLWSAAVLDAVQAVSIGESLKCYYELYALDG